MNYNKLSADPLALVLGILALVIGIAGCCCYGITAIIPLIMAIIGLVTANKSLRAFAENPEAYDPQSRSNVNTAKIINIIAIVMNGLIVLVSILAIAFYGTMISSAFLEGLNNPDYKVEDYYDEYESDSLEVWEDDDYIIEEESGIEQAEETEIDSLSN
ncbi:MAG: CCC motif membrane protein [Winogradskyella sp.]|uniref:CCC motif membrane protein n=1 Tax=Winogradskyella sp. TaxID=1883156 RepID=UPI00385CC887